MTANDERVLQSQKGYTVIEMVVVVAIFVIIMIITSKAFDLLIRTGSHQSKSSASNIEGLLGLEMLRRDLSHAGYGIPWSYQIPLTGAFSEVTATPASGVGVAAADFNEAADTGVAEAARYAPHPIMVRTTGAGATIPGSEYLVIKSVLLPLPAANSSVGRWGYLEYATDASGLAISKIKRVGDPLSDVRNGAVKDNVTTLATGITASGAQTRVLLNTASSFSYPVTDAQFKADDDFQPTNPDLSYVVYAIADKTPRMPYNRADYYVKRPDANDADFKIPLSCNPGTGILFKAVADHEGGYSTPYPLLNCVGDLRVVYSMDPEGDGSTSYFPASSPAVTALSPEQMRIQMKSVTVYVLAHEGKRDPNYTYPGNDIFVGPMSGNTRLSAGKTWSASQLDAQFPSWKNYRWKVYAIPVTPRNMQN